MAQSAAISFVKAFEELKDEDRDAVEAELARTGCRNQVYRRDALVDQLPQAGPAFLVYYGPALLQKNAEDPVGALQVLAEVLRQARALWPFQVSHGDETVTVRIDALKEMSCSAMQQTKPGEFWALQRTSGKDAQVVRLSMVGADGLPVVVDWESHKLLAIGAHADIPAVPPVAGGAMRGHISRLTELPSMMSDPLLIAAAEEVSTIAGIAPGFESSGAQVETRLKPPEVDDSQRVQNVCCWRPVLWCGNE